MNTHYDILGIQETSTPDEIKSAWREIAFALHPDRNQGKESPEFVKASVAWETLSDPEKRRAYDMQRSHPDMFEGLGNGDHPFTADVFNVLFEEAARMRGFFSEDGLKGSTTNRPVVRPHPILKKVSCPLVDVFLSSLNQCILWPCMEPIQSCAIDQVRLGTHTYTEFFS